MTSTFRERLTRGVEHEQIVARALEGMGWAVAPWGLGVLPEPVRSRMAQLDVLLRHMPDLLAVLDDVRLIDAKTGRSDTPNYCIEDRSLIGFTRWQLFDVDVWLVFGDLRCARAADVWTAPERRRHRGGNGSGTPYSLLPKSASCVRLLTEGFAP